MTCDYLKRLPAVAYCYCPFWVPKIRRSPKHHTHESSSAISLLLMSASACVGAFRASARALLTKSSREPTMTHLLPAFTAAELTMVAMIACEAMKLSLIQTTRLVAVALLNTLTTPCVLAWQIVSLTVTAQPFRPAYHEICCPMFATSGTTKTSATEGSTQRTNSLSCNDASEIVIRLSTKTCCPAHRMARDGFTLGFMSWA